jgi:hypothetical protein
MNSSQLLGLKIESIINLCLYSPSGTRVTTYAALPGVTSTNLKRYQQPSARIMSYLTDWFQKTPQEGCQTVIHCAINEGVEKESGAVYR